MGVSVLGFKIVDDDGCFNMGLLREILAEIVGTFFLIVLGCGGYFLVSFVPFVSFVSFVSFVPFVFLKVFPILFLVSLIFLLEELKKSVFCSDLYIWHALFLTT